MTNLTKDKRHSERDPIRSAPMPSAPLKYRSNGEVAWGEMWDSYCILALDGGPPHRGQMLQAPANPDSQSQGYRYAVQEIIRGIREVSGLPAEAAQPGWLKIECNSLSMAQWLAEAINEENVEARSEGPYLLLPVGDDFTLKGEIKNVVTSVAKTTHYWAEHVPPEVKQTLAWQSKMVALKAQCKRWLGRLLGRKASTDQLDRQAI